MGDKILDLKTAITPVPRSLVSPAAKGRKKLEPRKAGQKAPRKAPKSNSEAKKEEPGTQPHGRRQKQSAAARQASLTNLAKARAARSS